MKDGGKKSSNVKQGKFLNIEQIQQYNLVDQTERKIRSEDYVDVKCSNCDVIGNIKFKVLKYKLKKYGFVWRCQKCITGVITSKLISYRSKLSDKEKKAIREKTKKTNMEKHGSEYIGGAKEIREKVRETNLERYGHENISSIPEIREKVKKTNLEKYGVENVLSSAEIREKVKKTNMERYGAEEIGASAIIKEKRKQTNLEKYGNEHFFLSDRFEEMKKTNDWTTSKPEIEIKEYVESLGLRAEKKYLDGMEIDIFIPELNIGIEYHGLYWHCEIHKQNNYHYNKYKKAKESGLLLIQIFTHEWRDRQDQVKSRLRSILGKNSHKIGARKCEFKEITTKEANDFINKYHIQGSAANVVKSIGAFYQNELILAATFGKHHRNNKTLVLNRFCGKDDHTVSGGLSKMSKIASGIFEQDMVSWCDLRWSDGNGYVNAGWTEEEILNPDYFYTDFINVISKQSRRKGAMGTPVDMTEHEHALLDGLFRVYDCGKIRYKYKHD